MRASHSILRSVGVMNLFLRYNFTFPFILLHAFKVIGFPDKISFKTQPRYVTCECCCIFISLYFIFSFLALLILRLLAKIIDLVLSSPKYTVNLLSTNQSQAVSKSLFSCFSISSTSLCSYINRIWCAES